jgi:hypothetical protein
MRRDALRRWRRRALYWYQAYSVMDCSIWRQRRQKLEAQNNDFKWAFGRGLVIGFCVGMVFAVVVVALVD